ncbi:uncharacterized protein LOC120076417 [Benincasa hispida]|uniref:uncharacterized protein LOC120076417 n=1 Tax=Benincasa hispida TaxID=102211 RepID=UPI0019008294|nr:uncharacterized protein LOC120076417 [Benincasa hispida]
MDIDKIVVMVWQLWKGRNSVMFLRKHLDAEAICDMIVRHISVSCCAGEHLDRKGKGLYHPIQAPTLVGWHPSKPFYWKLNMDASWNSKIDACGLGWVFLDHLYRVCMAGLKFVLRCQKVNILEAIAICFGLEILSSIDISNIMVESDCLEEVINLLNDDVVDLSEVSFCSEEAKDRGGNLGVISFSHVRRYRNVLAY